VQRALVGAVAAALVVGGAVGAFVVSAPEKGPHAGWTEIAWQLPVDPWGRGRAFQCKAAACGTDVRLYVRPKLGFCNCTTGIASDGDLDAMGDLELLGAEAAPLGEGRPIAVGWMKGRARAYAVGDTRAVSVAFNDRCDMVVATAVLAPAAAAAVESHVIDFLNSPPMLDWTKLKLGI
jgi:hypothetical protein